MGDLILNLTQYAPGIIFVIFILTITALYWHDKRQKSHTLLRNFPIIGRFRYLFEDLAVFFRQYFAGDRSEAPYTKAERSWIYRTAKGVSSLASFGSTKVNKTGDIIFNNSMYPQLESESFKGVLFGNNSYVKNPYLAKNVINISGMSYGALSKPAVQSLSKGAFMAGSWVNTGEGGPSRYHYEGGADLVIQLGSAYYGFRDDDGNLDMDLLKEAASKESVKMIEVKLSQSAKPGDSAYLPAIKVTEDIARERKIKARVDSISPARHKSIYDESSLLEFVANIRKETGLPTGFKFCLGRKDEFIKLINTLLKLTDDRGDDYYIPDFITIDGDGGTGAAPLSLLDSTGFSLKVSLPFIVDEINKHEILKDKIKIIASGKLSTPTEVAWALCTGAHVAVTARGALFSMGCIQSLSCASGKCPTGLATNDKKLYQGVDPQDKSIRVMRYLQGLQKEVEKISRVVGAKNIGDLNRNHFSVINNEGEPIKFIDLMTK